ncbi:MAG: LCP family protein [Anaeromassilibacillus sp.]
MKQEYQSAYRKLNADPAFRDRLVRTLEEQQEPRRTRPRWMVPVALAACLILLFGLGVPTIKRVLQPIETVSSAPTANEGVILGSDGLYRDSEITNILCLCTDDGGDGNALMLVSVDQRGGGFKLSSFLPSLRVKTSDDREQALSALFQTEKNGDEAVSLIQQNFGLAVDGYLWIDASDMEAAINAIGGLTMELSEGEAAYFALSSSQDSFLEGGFTAGEHTLTGSQALFFTRVRMGTDYDRMIRQQKLAESLLRQIWNDPSSASEFWGTPAQSADQPELADRNGICLRTGIFPGKFPLHPHGPRRRPRRRWRRHRRSQRNGPGIDRLCLWQQCTADRCDPR